MGFLDGLRAAAHKAGGVLKRAGDIGGKIGKRVGEIGQVAKPLVSSIGAALAPVTGGASLGVAGAINTASDFLAKNSESLGKKVSGVGSALEAVGGDG